MKTIELGLNPFGSVNGSVFASGEVTRRRFVQSVGATFAACSIPTTVRAQGEVDLVAVEGEVQLAPSGYPKTTIWGYDGAVPGPTIRVRQGERVARRFVNRLPQASSIHWHGIRLENKMDGVVGLTQDEVASGEVFSYDFVAPDAGTYLYHPHNRSWEQMARGLSGALIVEEQDGTPEVDADQVLLIDDWRLTDQAQIAGGFGDLHDWAHAGRIGNWITVNGMGGWRSTSQRYARLRLRLINAATARVFVLEAEGLEGWVVALDGMPLETPQPLSQLVLGPAQRADVIVDVTTEEGQEAKLISVERNGSFVVGTYAVNGSARVQRLDKPKPLPSNSVPTLGPLASARRAELVMEGGAMGRMRGATMNGRPATMNKLMAAGKVWSFNGSVDMPAEPLVEGAQGETIRVQIRNDTAWPHAMHLHGHHFRQVKEGRLGTLRDTLLMQRGESAEIAFVADNPGDWLLHCHMLSHSAGGMMTWLRVT
jgi:FtsP/CotA-like multicopper oxidase with cupredoxin domain